MTKKFSETEQLAYWFVTHYLDDEWSYNLHRRYLSEAKFYVNPKPDGLTGEKQKKFKMEQIMGCLEGMSSGEFGAPILDIRTIHAVTWKNRKTGRTFLEDYLDIPPPPPLYRKMELRGYVERYEDRIPEEDLEKLKEVIA